MKRGNKNLERLLLDRQEQQWTASPTSFDDEPKKTIWPELVGLSGLQAKRKLQKYGVRIQIVPMEATDMITEDYQPHRVQVFVDTHGRVPWAPQLG
mmetsp:Transcript_27825/g.77962  ORF Transcript_27825/g.77962 Transcript_27825/m.77962 type:complete len:96 (+) Transcript_27825:344-631(+)